MGKIVAIIPAAGYSSRMEVFKPLLPLRDLLAIERPIYALRRAGVDDVRVIVGNKAELMLPVLGRLGVRAIMNPHYAMGMYSSIRTGADTLEEDVEAFFILPGDYPLVSSNTILKMKLLYEKQKYAVIYPCYEGRRGHPPLISTALRSEILRSEPNGGLKALLEEKALDFYELSVDDPGILLDLDNKADYRAALKEDFVAFPSVSESIEILQKSNVEQDIQLHAKEVCRVASILAENSNSRGYRLHLGLVAASALLHDIAKGEPSHAQKGKEIVAGFGYFEVADIVGMHMDVSLDNEECLTEASVVYLADKLVQGSKTVPLEERFQKALTKYEYNENIHKNVLMRFEKARLIKGEVEKILRCKLEEIIDLE